MCGRLRRHLHTRSPVLPVVCVAARVLSYVSTCLNLLLFLRNDEKMQNIFFGTTSTRKKVSRGNPKTFFFWGETGGAKKKRSCTLLEREKKSCARRRRKHFSGYNIYHFKVQLLSLFEGAKSRVEIKLFYFCCLREIEQNRGAQHLTPRACLLFKTHWHKCLWEKRTSTPSDQFFTVSRHHNSLLRTFTPSLEFFGDFHAIIEVFCGPSRYH